MYAIVKDGIVTDIVSLPEDIKLEDVDFLSQEQKDAAVEIPEDELNVRRNWKYDGTKFTTGKLREEPSNRTSSSSSNRRGSPR